jgi:hypothetical protein
VSDLGNSWLGLSAAESFEPSTGPSLSTHDDKGGREVTSDGSTIEEAIWNAVKIASWQLDELRRIRTRLTILVIPIIVSAIALAVAALGAATIGTLGNL